MSCVLDLIADCIGSFTQGTGLAFFMSQKETGSKGCSPVYQPHTHDRPMVFANPFPWELCLAADESDFKQFYQNKHFV